MTGNRCPNPTGIDQRSTARAGRGRAALEAYAATMPGYRLDEEDEYALSDLISDLLHYAASQGWTYQAIIDRAITDFRVERDGDDE